MSLVRSVFALIIAGLPAGIASVIATLDIVDFFRLRRVFTSLFVFGAGLKWEGGHMLGALVAIAASLVFMCAVDVLGVVGLRLLPLDEARRRAIATANRKAVLFGLGTFGVATIVLMVSYTLLMLAFTVLWFFAAMPVLRGILEANIVPRRELRLAGGLAVVLWLGLVIGSGLVLGRLGLVSQLRISVPAPSARHLLLRLGFASEAGEKPTALAFSPDGRTLHVRLGATTQAYDAATGDPRDPGAASFADGARAVSPDGAIRLQLVSGGGEVQLSGDGGGWSLPVHRPQRALALALSSDGKLLATAGTDNVVRLWDVPSGRHRRTYWGHSNDVLAVAFSPDGKRVASGSVDGTVRTWAVR